MKHGQGDLPNVPIEIETPSRKGPWGNWHFDESNLCLNLLPFKKYTHDCPFYQIDLETINSNSEMLDWIFQISWKEEDEYYYANSLEDLVSAFAAIFQPQKNCCSFGKDKDFCGGDLAKQYIRDIFIESISDEINGKHFGKWLISYQGKDVVIGDLRDDFFESGKEKIKEFKKPEKFESYIIFERSACEEALEAYKLAVAEFESSEG